jgi:pyruvate dehydrogenase E2 component (dihydrolipoamide acetyltransferase)
MTGATSSATTEFRMPSLGADMESGVLLEWLIRPGDIVHKGDIVAVVDTSKAAVEVECFASGRVKDLLVEPGTRVPVGDRLATIEVEATDAATASAGVAAVEEPSPPQTAPEGPHPPTHETPTPGRVTSPLVRRLAAEMHVDTSDLIGTGPVGQITHTDVQRRGRALRTPSRVQASPWARRIAAELGVALDQVRGSGPGGVVRAEDVRRAAAAAQTGKVESQRAIQAPAREASTEAMRATIAALMAKSKREVPHYYLTEQIDLGPAMAWLHDRNRALSVPERILPAALLLKAAARAAAEVPELNGFWLDGRFAGQDVVHLGVAISLRGGGLVAPAIHNADTMAVPALMAAMRDLVARTRAGRLRRAELVDATITVSSVGDQGAESILGVIYPPQVALVGFGRVVERPWACDGMIGVRPVVTASLSADHRATDGSTGSRYLQVLTRLLQRPEEL